MGAEIAHIAGERINKVLFAAHKEFHAVVHKETQTVIAALSGDLPVEADRARALDCGLHPGLLAVRDSAAACGVLIEVELVGGIDPVGVPASGEAQVRIQGSGKFVRAPGGMRDRDQTVLYVIAVVEVTVMGDIAVIVVVVPQVVYALILVQGIGHVGGRMPGCAALNDCAAVAGIVVHELGVRAQVLVARGIVHVGDLVDIVVGIAVLFRTIDGHGEAITHLVIGIVVIVVV